MKNILVLAALLVSVSSFAEVKKAGEFGIRMNKAFAPGAESKDHLSPSVGVILTLMGDQNFGLRSGGVFTAKTTRVEDAATKTIEIKNVSYFLDIPVTLVYKLNDLFQGYAGFDMGIKLVSDCTVNVAGVGCNLVDEKDIVFQPNFGVDMTVMPGTKVGVFYETETEYAKDFKQSAYGVKAGYDF